MSKKKRNVPPKKSKPTLLYLGSAILLIAAVLYFLSVPGKPQEKLPTSGEYVKLNMPSTYEPGKVKIIEFLKFDCPHCYDLHKDMPQLLKKHGDNNVSITYVPIVWPGQSTRSIDAYIIAEQMGKSEEMRDALFRAKFVKGMDVIESTLALENVASSIGLGEDFKSKLEGASKAAPNLALMKEYGVQATPTVIINGNLQVTPTAANLDAVIGSLLSLKQK